jgi:hypothetical protein
MFEVVPYFVILHCLIADAKLAMTTGHAMIATVINLHLNRLKTIHL